MYPWMMNSAGPLSLLQMYRNLPQSGGSFFPENYPRQPGFFRGQWGQSYQDDRSDQLGNRNQPDTGNAMAPPGQMPPGGPDDPSTRAQNPQAGYDYNTVSPGFDPGWMRNSNPPRRGRSPSRTLG